LHGGDGVRVDRGSRIDDGAPVGRGHERAVNDDAVKVRTGAGRGAEAQSDGDRADAREYLNRGSAPAGAARPYRGAGAEPCRAALRTRKQRSRCGSESAHWCSGDLRSFLFLRRRKITVLGLITTKGARMETNIALRRRSDSGRVQTGKALQLANSGLRWQETRAANHSPAWLCP
jgi:hypothetical protein